MCPSLRGTKQSQYYVNELNLNLEFQIHYYFNFHLAPPRRKQTLLAQAFEYTIRTTCFEKTS